MTDGEWEERQKARQLEMEAVSKALSILNSDDAHDLFGKTFNPDFVQKQGMSAAHAKRRAAAAAVLSQAAKATRDPRLATLAVQVRLDAFTKVKKAINDLIASLIQEKKDEIKLKDFCVEAFFQNERATEKKEDEKKDLGEKIDDLTMTIDGLAKEIDTLKGEIAEMEKQLKEAGEDREKENKEFQQTVADQRASQKLLASALKVLKGVYDKKAKAMVQVAQKQKAGPPPPPGFKAYKKNAAAGGVMGMIKEIINEAKALEAEAVRNEEDAQEAYEGFVKETQASVEEKNREVVNKSDEKAKAEDAKTKAEQDLEAANLELDRLSNENLDLHKDCDFTMKNFDARQTARDQEIEALKQAVAILSGAKFSEFLQRGLVAW